MQRPVYKYSKEGNYICSYKNVSEAARDMECDESTIRKSKNKNILAVGFYWGTFKTNIYPFRNNLGSDEAIQEVVKTYKNLEKERTDGRQIDKEFKKIVRIDNAIEKLNEELIANFNKVNWSERVISHSIKENDGTKLIIQLSDLHLNELIDIPQNQFNIKIASQRLQKYATKAKALLTAYGITEAIIALTGDMINSDRRIDEIYAKATSRSIASLVATKLLAAFIIDINTVANVSILSVSGNESRIGDDLGFTDILASDNYDFIIYNQLKLLLGVNTKGIKFIEGNPMEQIISVNGRNILITHGTTLKNDSQKSMQQVVGKYASFGTTIDYIIFGHVHFSMITDKYARSASLCGANSYSDRVLQLSTMPAQNMHIISKDGSLDNMRIDLARCDDYAGYNIEDFTDMYDTYFDDRAKSFGKRNYIVIEIE